MNWKGAGECTGIKAGSEHFASSIRRSDRVIEVLPVLGGRPRPAAFQKLIDVRKNVTPNVIGGSSEIEAGGVDLLLPVIV